MLKNPELNQISEPVITSLDQVNAEWLNQILNNNGVLGNSEITNFSVEHSGSTNAHIAQLRIEYNAVDESLPRKLLLKMCKNENDFVKDSEVNYYSRDYFNLENSPIPKCYDAQFSKDTGAYHILMEDLSETHHKDVEPTLEYGKAVADALAILHSYGWGDKMQFLGQEMLNETKVEQYINHALPGLEPMLSATGGKLDNTSKDIIRDIFDRFPKKMMERIQDPQGFTVVHGDTNPGNILYPNSGLDQTYLLDRQPFNWSLTTNLGVSDLSYMMVPYWDSHQRQKLEMPILKQYHHQLLQHGILNYSWEQLWDDYKLSAMQGVCIAADWCVKEDELEEMRWLWTLELQRTLQTYFDLDVAKLLE